MAVTNLPLQLDYTSISAAATLLASVAIILGTVFVVLEMRDNRRLVAASSKQANAAAMQLQQGYDLATVDLVTKIYDFANSLEVQRSWLTVLNYKLSTFEDFERAPSDVQLAFYQIASLFESLGLLVDKGYVKEGLVDDMFAVQLAWEKLEPFIVGMREKYQAEDYYTFMQRLQVRLAGTPPGSSNDLVRAAPKQS